MHIVSFWKEAMEETIFKKLIKTLQKSINLYSVQSCAVKKLVKLLLFGVGNNYPQPSLSLALSSSPVLHPSVCVITSRAGIKTAKLLPLCVCAKCFNSINQFGR